MRYIKLSNDPTFYHDDQAGAVVKLDSFADVERIGLLPVVIVSADELRRLQAGEAVELPAELPIDQWSRGTLQMWLVDRELPATGATDKLIERVKAAHSVA
jgi:hypothetical protein